MMPDEATDVIIAGAGPVGLALACELGLRGVDCVLIERLFEAGAPPQLFGFGISKPAQVRSALSAGAKGVICGSAIVECAALGEDVSELIRSLKGATGNDSVSQ